MLKRRLPLFTAVLLLLLAVGVYFAWNTPAVQDALLSHASLSSLSDTVAADPANWRAQYWYGRRSAEAGRLQPAESALRMALGSQPDYLPALTELGKVLLVENHVEEAFQVLRMVAGRDPRNREARVALATLYRLQGAYPRGVEVASEALRQDPDNVRALYELGANQALLQQRDAAEQTLRHALRVAPNDVPALVGLARILREKGELPEAETRARAAVKREPNNAGALVVLSQVLQQREPLRENRAAALDLLQKASTLEPDRADVPWEAAQILMKIERWPEAADALKMTVRRAPDRTQAYYLLARAYRQMGKLPESRQAAALFQEKKEYDRQVLALRNQIAADPDSPRLRFRLGDVYAAGGRPDLAATEYRGGLERDPRNERARATLAELLRRGQGQ